MKLSSLIFDAACATSVVGIWPRYIEPRLLATTNMKLPLHRSLAGLKIAHFTDLHFHRGMPSATLQKLSRRLKALTPDLIVFTGDFLCYSRLEDQERLLAFLNTLSAPLGCFCTFGNHDYSAYISRNEDGDYDVRRPLHPLAGIKRGVRALLCKPEGKGKTTARAQGVLQHAGLLALLEKTPFTLLENHTCTLPIGLNITGLGDYGPGRCLPKVAFEGYDERYPGIVLSHNPDSFHLLSSFPGDWILSGHTHGEQIHLPLLRHFTRKLARLENPKYTRGLFIEEGKALYVNRGIGSFKPFRFCSLPEILLLEVSDD